MYKYFKYLGCCLGLFIGMTACTNESSTTQTEEVKQVEAPQEEVKAQEVAHKDPEMIAPKEEEKVEEPAAKSAAELEAEAEKAEAERLKKEKEARRKRRKERARKKREAAKKAPKMDFSKKSYSFGTIMQGDEVEHIFKFTNTGKSDLIISDVSVTCGCTHPSYPFVPIAPGEEGEIKVHYNSAGKLGPQKPTVTIISNAIPKKQKIYMEGFVDAERAKPIKKVKKDTVSQG